MPHLVISDEIAIKLRSLINLRNADDRKDECLNKLQIELENPPKPFDEKCFYDEGLTILSHERLVDLARSSNRNEWKYQDNFKLSQLLRGAKVAIPIKRKPERSPELIEILRKIQLEQEEKEYAAMMPSNSDRNFSLLDSFKGARQTKVLPGQKLSTDEQEWKEVRQQLSAIINVLVSVAAVAVAVWWAGGTADPIWKTLVAMPLCILVAVAETVLYVRHWDNIRKKREKAQKGR